MKNLLGVLVLLSNWHFFAQINAANNQIQQQKDPTAVFEENKGQMKDQFWNPRTDVLYYGTSEGMNYYIKNSGMSYQLSRVESWKDEEGQMQHLQDGAKDCKQIPDKIGTYRVDAEWLNSNLDFEIIQGNVLDGYNNYYNVPEGVEPALFVKKYETLTLKNVWEGIDLHYYGTNGFLETDYLVAPGADYRKIQIKFKGAELSTDNLGNLIIKTSFGEIQEGALKVYQNNERIEAYWKISEDNVVSFEIPHYNANIAMRIDPLTRVWGTYYGGLGADYGYTSTVDLLGNVYLAGHTGSTEAITSGGHQNTLSSVNDAFLIKFNSLGIRLWGTYYGGSSNEVVYSSCADASGNLYLVGYTKSTSAIASNGHQNSFGGGSNSGDAFLIKFDSLGVRLWGTYYGGSLEEIGQSSCIDSFGNVYLAGYTSSSGAIAAGGHQNIFAGGTYDAFLVKFNSSGIRLWGTYYGGEGGEYLQERISIDTIGNIYLAGYTSSTFAIASGGFQNNYGGGLMDAFIVKFSSSGIRLWGTYYGGPDDDRGQSCCVDALGNIYLAGYTKSSSAIAYSGYQNNISGTWDSFLVKFNSSGVNIWGTYYGGPGDETSRSCNVDASGNVYLSGYTESTSSIASSGHQNLFGGGFWDAFLVKFSTTQNACTAIINTAGSSTICLGSSVLLSANIGSGLTYQWHNNGNPIFGATDSMYIVTQAGHYSVEVSNSSGCSNMSDTTVILSIPAPNIQLTILGGQDTLCDNGYILVDGADQFLWQDSSQLNYLEVNQSGTYTVTGIDANGCQATDSISVLINNSTDTILYVSSIDQYTLNGETYYQTAVYTQILTNIVGCDSTIVLDLDLGYTGLSDLENEEFSVYPNPARDYIFVNTIQMLNEPYTLLDSSGRKVLNGQLIDTSQKLDLREIVTGLYYLKVGNKVAKVQVAK